MLSECLQCTLEGGKHVTELMLWSIMCHIKVELEGGKGQ